MENLELVSLDNIQSTPVEFLWKPYIPQGKITIVQGDGGCGKTTLMLAITAAVTTGKSIYSGAVSAPASVLFQTAEDSLNDTIKPRLEQLGANCSMVHTIVEGERSLSLSDERIEAAIFRTNAALCVFDPVQSFANGADFNSTNGMRPHLKHLADVAEKTGCAIVLIGHLNKKSGKSQYRGLGSIDIYAAARSVITVGKIPDNENLRAIVHGKSNLSAPGETLAFEIGPSNGFHWYGNYDITLDELLTPPKKSDSQIEKAKRLIKSELADGGEVLAVEIQEIAEDKGISRNTLNRAKTALNVVSVKRGNQWYWSLPIVVDAEYSEKTQNSQSSGSTAITIYQERQVI
ncbi:hypothetical protein FACS1894120_1220 [Clostridia bacterium]|nr:hypothetical protein FACS1894120_1220 [Clostridia bacterium]